jgi:RNA polymerase subunit RPABC4/transcription elongation factor Spt4
MVDFLSLALRLESEGQYNLAKLARAAVDSLGRQAAYQQTMQAGKIELPAELDRLTQELSRLDADEGLLVALSRGAAALADGRLPLIHETPHPYVCRTCGHVAMGEAKVKCPTCGARVETFQWFAPIYWLEAFNPQTAVKKLRQTPGEVAALLAGLPEQALTQPAQDGGWAVRNILAHLRDAQGVLDFRLDLFAKEEHPLLESQAVFSWATREEEKPPTALEIFASYTAGREKILARLDELPYQAWQRTGFHDEFGSVSIQQQVSYFACHELTHLPQLERLRQQIMD